MAGVLRSSMRAGRVQDLPGLRSLWAHEVLRRGRDCVPSEAAIVRMMSAFDWSARSRVIEDRIGLRAAALVLEHSNRGGTVVRVETTARDEADRLRLIEWGLGLSRAAGAAVVQVWRPKGQRQGMMELGLSLARPFWRMDRSDLEDVPEVPLPPGYRLAQVIDRRAAVQVFNRSFAEHWRFQPLDPDNLAPAARPAPLELLAVTDQGAPAAVVWCEVDAHDPDVRPQPVGVVEVVGTLPEHRRRGLASALTAEALRRLRRQGAASASLYVDGLNPTRAYDVYGRLGFVVAFQYEVFEATLHA
jgi:ribosomal protein S18 acetylase RimI-like enzyme